MDTEIIDYFLGILNQFLEELRQEIKIVPLEHPMFVELEEMNLHALFFQSICSKIKSLPHKEQQYLFNEIYPEITKFMSIIEDYQATKQIDKQ